MAEHTPGPWVHVKVEDLYDVCPAMRPGAIALDISNEPNARLIAAAPDMLAALYEAREFIDGQIDVVDGSYGEPAPNRAMVLAQEIDAAIAKATGSSSSEEPHDKA